uniref:Ribosomal RNA-processing protein 14/surfeit locus protein 6 C-terminal domain-containing protein n=1 Tax=Lygus hesperus TaxID=30085 RepID=A0A0A9YM58_LYGHE
MPVNLSFGNFEMQEMQRLGKRGGGVRELTQLLKQARRGAQTHRTLLRSRDGAEMRQAQLLSAAVQRVGGAKVKDDPVRLSRALARRRQKKRQSAKQWAKRMQTLHEAV